MAICGLTLFPNPRQAAASATTPLTCIVCGDQGGVDVILNVILFIPFGLGLGLAGWSWRRTAAVAAIFSFAVEALQFWVVTGRDSSLGDLMTNTTGAVLGALLAPHLGVLLLPSPEPARRLLLGGTATWLGLLGLSACLQAPGASAGKLTSNWAHRVAKPNPFGGEVRSASMDGSFLPPSGQPSDRNLIRGRLERGEADLVLQAVSGPSWGHGWIFLLAASERPQLAVSQRGRSAILTVPALALRFKLRGPTLSLPQGLPPDSGVAVAVDAGRQGHRLWLATSYSGRSQTVSLLLSPAHGWGLIAPFGFAAGRTVRFVTGLCIAMLILPLGFWAAASDKAQWAGLVLALAVTAGLGLIPVLGGYPAVHWSEWLAAGAAAGGGWALRRHAAYLQLRCGSPSTGAFSSS